MKNINKTSLYVACYEAIENALESGDYSAEFKICTGFFLKNYDPEEEYPPIWERAVELHNPDGDVEVYTIAWDRNKHQYRYFTEAELFRGDVDMIAGCAAEIAHDIAKQTPETLLAALDELFTEKDA